METRGSKVAMSVSVWQSPDLQRQRIKPLRAIPCPIWYDRTSRQGLHSALFLQHITDKVTYYDTTSSPCHNQLKENAKYKIRKKIKIEYGF